MHGGRRKERERVRKECREKEEGVEWWEEERKGVSERGGVVEGERKDG